MAAPKWHGFVEDYVKGEQNSVVHEIAIELLDGNLQLLSLVEGIGPHLTNEDKHVRCRGTQLLSEVLHRLPTNFLSDKEVGVLADFYCNRLQDHYTVTPYVLQGLAALSTLPKLTDSNVVLIVQSIFKTVNVQTLVQSDRRRVYSMLAHFLSNRITALLPLGPELVYGYIQVMDMEKDPRCLVIAFQTVSTIVKNFPIDRFAEELFEVVGCYFPIDFTPPTNDVYKVSREDLILGLRGCLSASEKFSPFCLPMLLEKATSSVPSAKLDALQTLAACAEVYGAECLQEYKVSFWSEIRREVFSPQSDDLQEAALSALSAMTMAASNQVSETGKQSYLDSFVEDIFKDLQRHLSDPELRFIYQCSKILQALGWESDPARSKVIHRIVPLLVERFHDCRQASQRKYILDALVSFIKIATRSNEAASPMAAHKGHIFPMLVSVLSETSSDLRTIGIAGTHQLIKIPDLLSDTERHLVAEHYTNILLKDSNMDVRGHAKEAAFTMVTSDANLVKDQMLPALLQRVREEWIEVDSGDAPSADKPRSDTDFIFSAIGYLSCQPDLVKTSVPSLLTHIVNLDSRLFSVGVLQECRHTCKCLATITRSTVSHPASLEYLQGHLVPKILVLTISGALAARDEAVVTHWDVIQTLASCVRTVVQNLPNSNELVSTIVRTFMDGDLTSFNDVVNNNSIGFQPLKVTSPWRQTQLLSLLAAVVCSVPKHLSITQLDLLMARLQEVASGATHSQSSTAAAKCFAGLLNKLPTDSTVASVTENTCQNLLKILQDSSREGSVRSQALTLWSWVTKAVVMRGHPSQAACVDKVLECLTDTGLADTAAEAFHIILNDFDDIMITEMHADVRLMYKQRFFLQTSPRLMDGFNKASQDSRVPYLTALSHLLRHLPKEVLTTELPPLLPLLIQSLACHQVELQLSTMVTLNDLLVDQPKLLLSYVDDIIPNLLQLSVYKPSMNVRRTALRGLGLLTELPHPSIFPHQNKVISSLAACIDDHKRLVRQDAGKTRSEWYLVGTAEK